MNILLKKSGWLVVGALALGFSAKADVLFQNNSNDLATRFSPSQASLEYGNQVFLANPGASSITNFSFEYYGIGGGAGGAFSGSVQVDVRWYLNNGPPTPAGFATPGQLVYDSGSVPLVPTSRSVLDFSTSTGDFPAGGWAVTSSELTFTVQFSGMGAGDQVGVDLYSPPTVGSMFTDYWLNTGSPGSPNWELLKDANGVPIDIGQEWMGTAVPEPSTLALSLVGGFGLLIAVRRFRK